MLKKLTVGFATLAMTGIMAVAGVMPVQAQQNNNGAFDSNFNLDYPGLNLDIGQLFYLDALFGQGGGGLFGGGGGTQAVYIVQSGDTLRGIATRFYGNPNLFPIIAQANNIANPNVITPGQTLIIPSVSGAVGVGTGIISGGGNLQNAFLYSRLFGGDNTVSLGDLFIMNRLFNNTDLFSPGLGTGGIVSGGGLLGSGGLNSLGQLFILDQLFSGNGNGNTNTGTGNTDGTAF